MNIQNIAAHRSPFGSIPWVALFDAFAAIVSAAVVFGLVLFAMGICDWSLHILLANIASESQGNEFFRLFS